MKAIATITFAALGWVQFFAVLTGFSAYFGSSTFMSLLPAALLAWIPLVGAGAGMWGAHTAWGWSWGEAGALFFGGQAVIFVAAGIGHRLIKDLRDSYASHLLSSGVVLAFVARQLGHGKTTVTERHYAKYLPDGDVYQEPERLAPGEVPADLLARLPGGGERPETAQIPESLLKQGGEL